MTSDVKVSKIRRAEYQDPLNVLGFTTTKNISHSYRVEQAINKHPPRTTIYDGKPIELVIRNPFPIHDQFVTTNNVYHGVKRLEETNFQPNHPKAPGLERLDFIRPNFHLRVARGNFELDPVYHDSETHAAFKPRRRLNDVYGSPIIFTPTRNVFVPLEKDYVYPFDKNELHSLLRHAHPYLSTSHFYHRAFTPQELDKCETLNQIEKSAQHSDVAIKYRIRPMHDPFEQKANKQAISPDYIKRKMYFKYPEYAGCPPRVFPPVEHIGTTSLYTDSYAKPFSCNNKENFTHPLKICYLQPKISSVGVHKIPHMLHSENELYGSGRSLHSFFDLAKREHPYFDNVIHS